MCLRAVKPCCFIYAGCRALLSRDAGFHHKLRGKMFYLRDCSDLRPSLTPVLLRNVAYLTVLQCGRLIFVKYNILRSRFTVQIWPIAEALQSEIFI